jgi:hypothetical protein
MYTVAVFQIGAFVFELEQDVYIPILSGSQKLIMVTLKHTRS